jgi:Zn-dependent metalloprotease
MKKSSVLHAVFSLIFITGLLLGAAVPQPASASPSAQGQDNGVRYGYSEATGKLTFVGAAPGRPIDVPGVSGVGALGPQAQAMGIVGQYASAFGLSHPARELRVKSQKSETDRSVTRYQQVFQGIPVLGGELVVNTTGEGYLTSMNGEVSPDLSIDTTINFSAEQAQAIALEFMKKWYADQQVEFQTSEPEQWIYDPRLLENRDGQIVLGWRMEVTPEDIALPIRELVLVDAKTGNVPLHFNQVDAEWQLTDDPAPTDAPTETPVVTATPAPTEMPTVQPVTGQDMGALTVTSRYIATTGSDSGTCTNSAAPCATINYAIGQAGGGDTILVATGTYLSTTDPVVGIDKNLVIRGGWNGSFTAQTGASTIDGQNTWQGVYVTSGTTALLERFTIAHGHSNGGAGGVFNSGDLTLKNITIANNVGYRAGGIDNYGTLTIESVTIADNTIPNTYSFGAGLYNEQGGTAVLKNTIIAGNHYSSDCRGQVISRGNNLIGSIGAIDYGNGYGLCNANWSATDLVGYIYNRTDYRVDPLLGPLQDVGGGVLMQPLLPGSPAIDWIEPAACDLATDQRGVSRPQGSACDIGAYELEIERSDSLILKTYSSGNTWTLRRSLVCDQSDLGCSSGDLPEQKAHEYAYDTYDFYKTRFGRDSIDGNGMAIISNIHVGSNYGNAFWLTQEMVYGDKYGFALADDVVAHELTHGLTQSESNLFYWYQSGAINESLSDIFGEAVDQANGAGNDSAAVEWLLGEDVSGLGALRSLSNPPAFGDPDKMTSSLYRRTSDDNGGVHHNSGVGNKAAYLMVAGGTFNNRTVTPLGWDKGLAIYYEANTHLLTSGSDYADLYNDLYQACVNLNLAGANGISLADCQEVRDATNAVQMNSQPASNFNPNVSMCPSGYQPDTVYFQDDFENGTDAWTFAARSGQSAWQLRSGYGHSGDNALWADDGYTRSDSLAILAQPVALPSGVQVYLHFDHAFSFDTANGHYYDGGVLEYSTNGGSTWADAKPLFNAGKSYGGTVANWQYASALKGRSAFVGDSHGYVQSRYKLSSLSGKSVLLRWRMATDAYGYVLGWYVDDVQIYRCLGIPSTPALSSPASGALITTYTPLLNWGNSTPDLDHYQLQLATDNAFSNLLVDDSTLTVSQHAVSPALAPAATYYWRVRAFNYLGGTKGWSAPRSFRTIITAPLLSEPAGGSTPSSLRPLFDWSDVPSAAKYTIQVSKYSNLSSPIINTTISGSSYTPSTDLPAGVQLYWRVRATNSTYGPSAWTNSSFITPKPPSRPSLLKPANGALTTDYAPRFDWSTSSIPPGTTFDHYQLQVATDSGFVNIVIDQAVTGASSSEYTPLSDLAPNTKYYWHVRSFNTLGQYSSWSSTWNFRAAMLPPALTSPSNGEVITSTRPLLDWEQVVGASGYSVQVSTAANFSSTLVNVNVSGGTTTQYQVTVNLPRNRTIYWRVRATGPNGPTPWTTQTFTIQ